MPSPAGHYGVTDDRDADARTAGDRDADARTGTGDRREALLWGVVGALSFLVLLQGYELLTEAAVAVPVKFGVAALVGLGATAATAALQGRVAGGADRQR